VTPLRRTISRNIAEVREARGMSQAELGKATGLSPTVISRFETGRGAPNFINLLKLANALNVTIDLIFGRTYKSVLTGLVEDAKTPAHKVGRRVTKHPAANRLRI
jgi:transcriptional regulator with XRE-family HTH domain